MKPSDYAAVVRRNVDRTTGLVLAESGECMEIRDAEAARIRRALRPLASRDLAVLQPPDSWLMGVILCAGDALDALAAWVSRRPASARTRIRLYHHPECDLVELLRPWYAAGLDDPRADEVDDFASFHRLFGNDLNDQIYADAIARGT